MRRKPLAAFWYAIRTNPLPTTKSLLERSLAPRTAMLYKIYPCKWEANNVSEPDNGESVARRTTHNDYTYSIYRNINGRKYEKYEKYKPGYYYFNMVNLTWDFIGSI